MEHRSRRLKIILSGALVLGLAIFFTSTSPGKKVVTAGFSSVNGAVDAADTAPNDSDSSPAVQSGAATAVENVQPGLVPVAYDIDGDTIVVKISGREETVRFIGADTPETHDPRKPVQCFGETAAAHTKSLVTGKSVRLAADPSDSDRDKYGRLLRYVYLPDGTLLNSELIRDGYAFAYTIFPFSKLEQFRGLETQARNANVGLWAGCNVDSSQQIEQTAGAK
jgi:endonuclease YncB( thermonuclease family)